MTTLPPIIRWMHCFGGRRFTLNESIHHELIATNFAAVSAEPVIEYSVLIYRSPMGLLIDPERSQLVGAWPFDIDTGSAPTEDYEHPERITAYCRSSRPAATNWQQIAKWRRGNAACIGATKPCSDCNMPANYAYCSRCHKSATKTVKLAVDVNAECLVKRPTYTGLVIGHMIATDKAIEVAQSVRLPLWVLERAQLRLLCTPTGGVLEREWHRRDNRTRPNWVLVHGCSGDAHTA